MSVDPRVAGPETDLRAHLGGADIVRGSARYTADFALPGMLHAKVLRSPYPHARIRRLDCSRARRLAGVRAVATYADVPKYRTDRPFLTDRARFVGDPVVAVAATDPCTAEMALTLIDIEWEPLAAVFDPREALAPGAPRVHAGGNLATVRGPAPADRPTVSVVSGDIATALSGADVVFTDSYRTPYQCHAHIEPHCTLARWEPDGRLTVWNSAQHPFSNQRALAGVFGLPDSHVRVVCHFLGGSYGGKDSDELGKAHHDAIPVLLARLAGAPVRYQVTHRENLTCLSLRHPFEVRLTTGANRDGTLRAVDVEIVQNTGAYADSGPRVLQVAASALEATYRCEAFRFTGYAVYTNTPVGGEMWGFGVPQITFAVERHLDQLAERLGLDAVHLRLRNATSTGDPLPGRLRRLRYRQARGRECLNRALEIAGPVCTGVSPADAPGRGARLSVESSGGQHSDGLVAVRADGRILLPLGVGNMGTASHVAIARLVAEVFDVSPRRLEVWWGDSARGAWDYGGDSSRAVHCTAQAFVNAAWDARAQLLQAAAGLLRMPVADLRMAGGHVTGSGARVGLAAAVAAAPAGQVERRLAEGPWHGGAAGGRLRPGAVVMGRVASPDAHTLGLAREMCRAGPCVVGLGFGSREITRAPWGAQVADVSVDRRTGAVRLLRVVTVSDVGRVVSPRGARAQIEGGTLFSAGFALHERFVFDPRYGPLTVEMRELGVPRADVVPDIVSSFLTGAPPAASHAALGLGETAVQAAAAIANAVSRAVGEPVRSLPVRAEEIAARWRPDR